ncbi:phenolic glucoside malonyltransferase 1-like [Euphorbia lathyris]|uniref:phenolic glucoside malonyltransferase 1-like n=1 Tax=Euphorbia lathyris TaxID=212925 RepID=UPI0033132250
MEKVPSVKIVEVSQVTPNDDSATELSLPLTYFDILLLKYFPTQRIFFYKLSQDESTRTCFNSVILPKLKHSLSLTLVHYLPLAGNITWPEDAPKPFILYSPNDGISLLFGESNSDFNHLCQNQIREAAELHPYVPDLSVSDSKAAITAIQITFFPNQGFSIGISSHHGVSDGKSVAMFMKSWGYICNKEGVLPVELSPVFDRTIHDPIGLDMIYLKTWSEAKFPGLDSSPKSLKLMRVTRDSTNLVRSTFELSREEIDKLKHKVRSCFSQDAKEIQLSTFVVSYAYIVVSIGKAKKIERKRKVAFTFPANCRARLEPPLSNNYFGNCTRGYCTLAEAESIIGENGIGFVAEKLSEKIKELKKVGMDIVKEMEEQLGGLKIIESEGAIEEIGVAGSPQFGMYGTDFGWGKPEKVEIVSIDKSGSNIVSMAETKDGNGGVEIGVVMEKNEMEMFTCLFYTGLSDDM